MVIIMVIPATMLSYDNDINDYFKENDDNDVDKNNWRKPVLIHSKHQQLWNPFNSCNLQGSVEVLCYAVI